MRACGMPRVRCMLHNHYIGTNSWYDTPEAAYTKSVDTFRTHDAHDHRKHYAKLKTRKPRTRNTKTRKPRCACACTHALFCRPTMYPNKTTTPNMALLITA